MKSSAYTPLLSTGIPYWGMGGVVLPTTQKFAHFPQHEKFPHPPPPTRFLTPKSSPHSRTF